MKFSMIIMKLYVSPSSRVNLHTHVRPQNRDIVVFVMVCDSTLALGDMIINSILWRNNMSFTSVITSKWQSIANYGMNDNTSVHNISYPFIWNWIQGYSVHENGDQDTEIIISPVLLYEREIWLVSCRKERRFNNFREKLLGNVSTYERWCDSN
jgi:hypothetical protein